MTQHSSQDSFGIVEIDSDAIWGPQTQRALINFPVSGYRMPWRFIEALCLIKQAAAHANGQLGLLKPEKKEAIIWACEQLLLQERTEHFPLDIFQTGSGTSTNMNANEVIAHMGSEKFGLALHPNDDVNMSQSSNDVIPSAIALGALLSLHDDLMPALIELQQILEKRAKEHQYTVKTGRTHLMDALPVTIGQELMGWWHQIESAKISINHAMERISFLTLGGTAVGSGLNAPEGFSQAVIEALNKKTHLHCSVGENFFELMGAQDRIVGLSGALRTLAGALTKICNDLRWMNSGPFSGLSEIKLPALQAGSSIMPGKINPVIPESVLMVCMHVFGSDHIIAHAGHSGAFQLNVMLPLIGYHLLENVRLLANAVRLLGHKAILGFEVNLENLKGSLEKNPIVITSLNQQIGYDLGAKIAKEVYASGRTVLEVAQEHTNFSAQELQQLLDPLQLTGIKK